MFLSLSLSLPGIGIDNHSVVYSACEQIRANWEDLATHLSVARPSVLAIEADGKNSADRLRKLLDEWLKRSSPEQPLPSWRGLCNALAHLDRLLSESISAQHQCGCSLCTGVIIKISFYSVFMLHACLLLLISKTRETIVSITIYFNRT